MGWGLSDVVNPGSALASTLPAGPVENLAGAKAYNDGKDDQQGWYGIGGTLGDILQFQSNEGQNIWHDVQDHPYRALLGSGSPLSTKLWNAILGKEDRPLVNEWGGPTSYDYKTSQDRGIDNQDNAHAHALAQLIASYYAGSYLGEYGGAFAKAAPLAKTGLNDWLHSDYMNGYRNPNGRGPTQLAGMSGLADNEYAPPSRGAPNGRVTGGTRYSDDDAPINQGWTLKDVWQRMRV